MDLGGHESEYDTFEQIMVWMTTLTTPSIIDSEICIHLVDREGLNAILMVVLNEGSSNTVPSPSSDFPARGQSEE
jgi:hypothetical protein